MQKALASGGGFGGQEPANGGAEGGRGGGGIGVAVVWVAGEELLDNGREGWLEIGVGEVRSLLENDI